MNKIYKTIPLFIAGCLLSVACTSDWDDHYDETGITLSESSNVTIYNGSVSDLLRNAADLTKTNKMFERTGILADVYNEGQYTFIVCDDQTFDAAKITDEAKYAKLSVSNIGVNPAKLIDGSNINTRAGKSLWVSDNGKKLNKSNITKIIKADNGYVYYVDAMLDIRPSAYELLMSLGDEYSTFKNLVKAHEDTIFDRENSKQIGVSADGRPVYDSVTIVKNDIMDRYDENGKIQWNMRSESYNTTMFIPTNDQIKKAIKKATENIPTWLNRQPTAADTAKFEQWILTACFSDRNIPMTEVSETAADFQCVGGYYESIDEATSQTSYKAIDAAWWRPSVQKVDAANGVELSNGMAYYCNEFKIPNHIVIYRVKSRLYDVWNNGGAASFTWNNWVDPMVIENCQGQFDLAGGTALKADGTSWPSIYYHELCAIPSQDAMDNNLPCSVEYKGVVWDEASQTLNECYLPAGEYYLRMGFKHSLRYSLSISFNGTELVKDMNMYATGSDYHFDRGSASETPRYGEESATSYPEGFDVDYWQIYDPKAIAYDTDGTQVGIVNIAVDGTFTIKVESSDMARIYKATLDNGTVLNRDKNNIYQLMMYHWCLRPTHNNY